MTTTVLRKLVDTWVAEEKPAQNYADAAKLRLGSASGNVKEAYLFFGGGPRPGVFVTTATLLLHARLAWTGSPTITVQAITEPWRERAVTWKQRPASTATDQATLAPGALADDDLISIDVTDMVRAGFLGAPFYGFRITATGSTERNVHSSEAADPDLRPMLEISFSRAPTQAADLTPGDGAVVSVAYPVLGWVHYDEDGDDQAAAQVQIDGGANFVDPEFDTGWISATESQVDLADTAFTGLADGQAIYWRVRTEDSTGVQSAWSDPVRITRLVQGTLTIDAPTSVVEESTPEIVTTLTDRAQAAIAYRLQQQVGPGKWRTTWDTDRMAAPAAAGAPFEFEVPTRTDVDLSTPFATTETVKRPPIRLKDTPYRLRVRVWDSVEGRVATPGDPTYVEAEVEFEWQDAVVDPDAPSSLVVTQEGPGQPGVLLEWVRSAVPDFWALIVDDELVIDKVPALDWQVAGTSYAVTWYGAEPGVEHVYEILALEVA